MDTIPSELTLEPRPSPAAARPASSARASRGGPPRGILAVVDGSAGGMNAAWRAALVARDLRSPLHLAAIQPRSADALAAESLLQGMARQLEERLQVRAKTFAVGGELRNCVVALAAGKELVVVPWQAGASWADKVLGTLPQRMLRWLATPVLVVHRPAMSSYRRVLAPVKLDVDAHRQIAAARRLIRGQSLRVFHVLEPGQEGSLRLAGVSEHTVSIYQQRRIETAYGEMEALIERTGADAAGAAALIAFGHVPRRVLEAARGHNAQLIVTGAGRRSVLGEVLCGGVVQDLLREAEADLLVVPLQDCSRPPASHDQSRKE